MEIMVTLLKILLIVDGILLALFVLIQKGKSSMGLGALGGGAQTIFGGSGGQDLFQKITWVLGAIFMTGSLFLTVLQARNTSYGSHMKHVTSRPIVPITSPMQTQKPTEPAQKPVQ